MEKKELLRIIESMTKEQVKELLDYRYIEDVIRALVSVPQDTVSYADIL
jgi:Mg/Co/Ni transporter MgtE